MSQKPSTFATTINEGSSAVYTATLADENGTAIGSGNVDTLTLTLSNVDDGTIINSRTDQDVLNANNVTVSGGGALVYTLQAVDTIIVDSTKDFETRRATFKLQFNTVSFLNWDVDFMIRNLSQVP